MWELRLILLLIGVIFVAGVYLFSRPRKPVTRGLPRTAPALHDSDLHALAIETVAPVSAPATVAQTQKKVEPPATGRVGKQLILALHVAPRTSTGFSGAGVLAAMQGVGLQYGNHKVFHRSSRSQSPRSMFSVASMMEPGTFDLQVLPRMLVPGLTLFMRLPGPENGVAAYADMLATARALARRLDGEVLDDTRSTLTRQTAHHIRERIIEFQRQTQLQQAH